MITFQHHCDPLNFNQAYHDIFFHIIYLITMSYKFTWHPIQIKISSSLFVKELKGWR